MYSFQRLLRLPPHRQTVTHPLVIGQMGLSTEKSGSNDIVITAIIGLSSLKIAKDAVLRKNISQANSGGWDRRNPLIVGSIRSLTHSIEIAMAG